MTTGTGPEIRQRGTDHSERARLDTRASAPRSLWQSCGSDWLLGGTVPSLFTVQM